MSDSVHDAGAPPAGEAGEDVERLRLRLARSERTLREVTSIVSHDLKTPLTSLIASLSLLESGVFADRPERIAELSAIALRNGERQLRLIEKVVDLVRLTSGDMPLEIEPFKLEALLSGVLAGQREAAAAGGVDLRLAETPEPDALVLADRARLRQVLEVLIANAIRFSPGEGRVRVAAERHGDRWSVRVSDQGSGISKELREEIFGGPPSRETGSLRRTGGSGWGLARARALVEAMDGAIEVAGEAGEGTTVRVDLPAA